MAHTGDDPRPARLTRKEAQARTRASLLDAAAEVFARKGFAAASVDDVAEAAGFTTGALYSNFGGKEDLFLELFSRRSGDRMAEALKVFVDTGVPIDERSRALADHLLTVAEDDGASGLLEAEFWLYAMRRPEFRRRWADQFRDNRDALSGAFRQWAQVHDRGDDLPFEALSTILVALFQGLLSLRRADPALVPGDLYAQASRWLLAGVSAPPGPPDRADPADH